MKISWWLTVNGTRKPRNDKMRGPGLLWDATCICGWDSATGGAKMGDVRALVDIHKGEHGAGRTATGEPVEAVLDLQAIELQQALGYIEQIDRLGGSEYLQAIGSDRAQRALETVGRLKGRSAGAIVTVEATEDVS